MKSPCPCGSDFERDSIMPVRTNRMVPVYADLLKLPHLMKPLCLQTPKMWTMMPLYLRHAIYAFAKLDAPLAVEYYLVQLLMVSNCLLVCDVLMTFPICTHR